MHVLSTSRKVARLPQGEFHRRGFELEARYSYSHPPEIAEFPLRFQSASVRHFVTGASRDTRVEPPLEA